MSETKNLKDIALSNPATTAQILEAGGGITGTVSQFRDFLFVAAYAEWKTSGLATQIDPTHIPADWDVSSWVKPLDTIPKEAHQAGLNLAASFLNQRVQEDGTLRPGGYDEFQDLLEEVKAMPDRTHSLFKNREERIAFQRVVDNLKDDAIGLWTDVVI